MATGGKCSWKAVKRFFPGNASVEDDQDTGRQLPKQRRIESDVPGECSPAAVEMKHIQPRDSGARDTDPYSGSSTDSESTISDLLAEGAEYQLYQLTKFYRDRLTQAIEEGVAALSWMLRQEGHFTAQEHAKVAEQTEKGNWAESSTLILSLVMGKGSQARRAMWESFVKMRSILPKLDGILKEIEELGPDPQEYMDIAQGLSELPTQLIARVLEEFLGPFPHETTLQVINWVTKDFTRQIGSISGENGKGCLLQTLHYLFESRNHGLAQATVGSVEKLSLSGFRLTPVDCMVLSHVIGLCDTIKHLDLRNCDIRYEGFQRLEPELHKCQELGLGQNELGDSGVKLVSAALKNPACKIQKLQLERAGLTDSGAEDLGAALSTNQSLTELDVSGNKLGDSGVKLVSAALKNPESKIQKLVLIDVGLTDSGTKDLASTLSANRSLMGLDLNKNKLRDSGVKLVSAALRDPECKIQKLGLNCVGLTDSGADNLFSALSMKQSLMGLDLGLNSLTDRSISTLCRLVLTLPSLEWIWLVRNQFSETGRKKLISLQECRPGLRVIL